MNGEQIPGGVIPVKDDIGDGGSEIVSREGWGGVDIGDGGTEV